MWYNRMAKGCDVLPKITKIEAQKNKKRVNIYVDGEYFISMDASLVYKFRVKIGEEIDSEKIRKFVYEDDFEKAKNKALNSISRSFQSEKRIREKLSRDYHPEIVDRVVEFAKKYSLIDDSTLGELLVSSGQNSKRIGKNRIVQELYKKGIDRKYTDDLIDSIDEDKELENARYLAKKRLERLKDQNKNVLKRKLYQHLSYKGFGYDVVNKVIRELLD